VQWAVTTAAMGDDEAAMSCDVSVMLLGPLGPF
jgi:hypothetical protein